MVRRSSTINTQRIDHIFNNPNLKLFYGDLTDYSSIASITSDVKPELFLNLGAMSHVRVSFDIPESSFDINATSVIRCLEAIRKHSPDTRFLTASSSELFGSTPPPQSEITAFHPRSPYAVAKLAGYWATINYRESYGMHCSNAISFNTESEFRGETFFTKKITKGAARIKLGLQDKIYCGNLNFGRDWIAREDTCDAIYRIITADVPDDFVIGSGKMRTGKEFIELVFGKLGLDWTKHIEFDSKYLRPAEVDALCANPTKIKEKLGWELKIPFDVMVDKMIAYDMKLAAQEKFIKESEKK